jgi:predicted kinase
MPEIRPALVVLGGLPGVGKSRLAREVAAQSPVTVISTDRVRRILVAHPTYSDKEHAFVHAVSLCLARLGLDDGRSVIIDATNLRQAHRQRFQDLAYRHQALCYVVALECAEGTVRMRLQRRAHGDSTDGSTADEHIYDLLRKSVEPIREPHLRLRGDGDVTLAAGAVVRLLTTGAVALGDTWLPSPGSHDHHESKPPAISVAGGWVSGS